MAEHYITRRSALRRLGAVPLLLAAASLSGCVLEWSPDSRQIAFLWSGKSADRGAIALMQADGGGFRVLSGTDGATAAQWSPDGKSLYVAQNQLAQNPSANHKPPAAGAPPESNEASLLRYDLTAESAEHSTRLPDELNLPFIWRPDEKESVSFELPEDVTRSRSVSQPHPRDETDRFTEPEAVWTNLAGKVTKRVTIPAVGLASGFFLPNSEDIAFLGMEGKDIAGPANKMDGNDRRLVKMDVYTIRGGKVKKLTDNGDVVGLALSPDHTKLIWARGGSALEEMELGLFSLTLSSGKIAPVPFPDRLAVLNSDAPHPLRSVLSVTFAPDGSRMAIVSDHGAYRACYSVGADGGEGRLVRKEDIAARDANQAIPAPPSLYAAFSPDSKYLAVIACDAAAANKDTRISLELYRSNGSGGKPLQSMQIPAPK